MGYLAPFLLLHFASFNVPACVAQEAVKLRIWVDLREGADEPHGCRTVRALDYGGRLVWGRHRVYLSVRSLAQENYLCREARSDRPT